MKKLLLFVILVFASFSISAQENKLPSFITDSLENYIQQGMKDWNIPGMAVVIVKDGKVILCKGYGVKKTGTNDPVDENTLFMIASNTKLFTATTLAILQSEGKLKLSDKVIKYMPDFRLRDSLATREVTINDLLSHRIGFETFQGDFTNWNTSMSRADIIHNMAVIRPIYSFRTQYGYCNAAFLAAGEIIPLVTGKSWEETVKEKILTPLKMNNTLMLSKDFPKAANIAIPHSITDGKLVVIPIPDIDNLGPAASMCSSVSDLSKWLLTQLSLGMADGAMLIDSNAIKATRDPKTIVRFDQRDKRLTHFSLYALGIGISDRDGRIVYTHSGGADGFVTQTMFIPEEKLGIAVLTNTDQNEFYRALPAEIRDAFLGLPFQDISRKLLAQYNGNLKQELARMDSLRNIISNKIPPSLPLKSYTGTYVNEVYGKIELKIEDEELRITSFQRHPGMTARLESLGNDNFLCTYSYQTLGTSEMPFKVENGKVTGLTLRVSDFVEFLPYEFIKVQEPK